MLTFSSLSSPSSCWLAIVLCSALGTCHGPVFSQYTPVFCREPCTGHRPARIPRCSRMTLPRQGRHGRDISRASNLQSRLPVAPLHVEDFPLHQAEGRHGPTSNTQTEPVCILVLLSLERLQQPVLAAFVETPSAAAPMPSQPSTLDLKENENSV